MRAGERPSVCMCLPCRSWAFTCLGATTRVLVGARLAWPPVKGRQGRQNCADENLQCADGPAGATARNVALYDLAYFPFSTATVGIRQGGSAYLHRWPGLESCAQAGMCRERIGPALLVIHPWGGEPAALSWTGWSLSCVMAKATCPELYSRSGL